MKMPVKILVLYLFLLLAIVASAQTLSVNHFDVDTKFDLSARMNMVEDLNGIPCALVKVSCLDSITRIEGSVIKRVEKDIETFLYLPSGSKYLKFHTLHHVPLNIFVQDYIPEGLQSNTVYQLELKSDLPSEVLFGSSDATRPVKMESKDSPLLPDWWNTTEKGLYVGISYPSFDGESAKCAAILNAVDMFAVAKGMDITYVVRYAHSEDIENSTSKEIKHIQQSYDAKKIGFTFRILQEYYNSKGEYFVLCAIDDDKNSPNGYRKQRSYLDENGKGYISHWSVYEIVIKRQTIGGSSYYTCEWSNDSVRYSDKINGHTLLDLNYSLSDFNSGFLNRQNHSLGFDQKQFLSSVPLLPDSLRVASDFSSRIVANEEKHSYYMADINGSGISQSIGFRFYEDKNGGIISMIMEKFPKDPKFDNLQEINERELEHSGLDRKYYGNSDKFLRANGNCESPLWERSKNNALIEAILEAHQRCGKETKDNPIKECLSSKIKIYPLWFMDATLRSIPNKKKNKDWESTLKSIDNRVEILVPLNGY